VRPTFHIVAGPNGAGKTTFYEQYLRSRTRAEFVNPDLLAREALGHWSRTAADAALGQDLATARRASLMAAGESLVMESTFSHASKLDLVDQALTAGYRLLVYHLSVVDADFAVERVEDREAMGGHPVPDAKVRGRYDRNGPIIRKAILRADDGFVFDNSVDGRPPRLLMTFQRGQLLRVASDLPAWALSIYAPDLAAMF
jgi:predicted ABC-type ATPase